MRTNNEPATMRELHEIRAKHYEETKSLTPELRARTTNENAAVLSKKFGFTIVSADDIRKIR